MHDSRTTGTMAVTALVLALAAFLAGPAQASLLEAGPSGGGGGQATPATQFMSHRSVELLAEQQAFQATSIEDRNLAVQSPNEPSTQITTSRELTSGDGFTWTWTLGGAALVAAAMGALALAGRQRTRRIVLR